MGEKTPAYSFLPHVAGRIRKHLPHAKLIWIFRDPVARAYSHYWQNIRNGRERASFEAIVSRAQQTAASGRKRRTHLDRGRYAEQVRRYLEFFPREQMLFLLFEDLRRNPVPVVRRVLDFLEVDPDVEIGRTVKRNVADYRRRIPLLAFAGKHELRNLYPFKWIDRINRSPASGYPPIEEETRALLKQYFARPNAELAELIGQDLSAWDE